MSTFRKAYRNLTTEESAQVEAVKVAAEALEAAILAAPPSRERSIAMTQLEVCVMWSVKGLTS